MNVGDSQTFEYSGAIVPWTVPNSGWYMLEAWGGQGGQSYDPNHSLSGGIGGKGGYSVGCVKLKKNQTLYVAVGGSGTRSTSAGASVNGGFNGGGNAINYGSYGWCGSGGGATHIALVNGLLKNIGYTDFVTNKKGLIVAGGGGGSSCHKYASVKSLAGGNGGGLVGGNGNKSTPIKWGDLDIGQGGTQDSGYAFGQGGGGSTVTNAGVTMATSGGGGGLYGGTQGINGCQAYDCTTAGGGSSFIGNLEDYEEVSAETTSNVREGNGIAVISFIAKGFPELKIGDETIDGINFADIEIEGIAIGNSILE